VRCDVWTCDAWRRVASLLGGGKCTTGADCPRSCCARAARARHCPACSCAQVTWAAVCGTPAAAMQTTAIRLVVASAGEKLVRMAYLGVIAAHTVNGVAEIHSGIIKESLFKDFAEMWPDKFANVTNGVTQRRWLAFCNEPLRRLLSKTLGSEAWIKYAAAARTGAPSLARCTCMLAPARSPIDTSARLYAAEGVCIKSAAGPGAVWARVRARLMRRSVHKVRGRAGCSVG
jgi:Carbohydrate phosphorylase